MSFRFDFSQRDPVDLLLGDASRLRRSLSVSADLSEAENPDRIIQEAKRILCNDLARKPGSIKLNGTSLAKIFLSLTYSQATWSDFNNFFKIALLDSIYNYHTSMTAKDVANTLWALARLGCPTSALQSKYHLNSEITDCLLQTVVQTCSDFTTQTCSNVLWSFAVLDLDYSDIGSTLHLIFQRIFAAMDSDVDLSQCDDKEIKQFMDFIDYYKEQFPLSWSEDLLRLKLCLNHRIKIMEPPRSSLLHRGVEKTFKRCCASAFQSEFSIAGGYADICFTQEKIVFEINGPMHYDKNGELNTHSRFRQRMMEKCGYQVFHIHYLDWQNSSDKNEFIYNLLLAAGLPIKKAVAPLPSLTIFMPPLSEPGVMIETTLPSIRITIRNDLGSLKRKVDDMEDGSAKESARKYTRY